MDRSQYIEERRKLAHLPDNHPAVQALTAQYQPAAAPIGSRNVGVRQGQWDADTKKHGTEQQETIRNGLGQQVPNPLYRKPS